MYQKFVSLATLLSLFNHASATCGETAALVCYDGSNGSTPQNVSLDDVAYAAAYRRNIGQSNTGLQQFWRMPSNIDCQEWELPIDDGETVLPLAKHIDHRHNSSVLYTDLANAIDGGKNPTPAQLAASLIGACGTNGGMVGVKFDSSAAAYNSPDYKATGDVPGGIIVKIVHNPGN